MSNPATLDKDAITWGQKQYHIALCPGDIGEYVLLPGDPARSDIAAKYLENAELKAFRLYLSKEIGNIIKRGMYLLGIDVPSRM